MMGRSNCAINPQKTGALLFTPPIHGADIFYSALRRGSMDRLLPFTAMIKSLAVCFLAFVFASTALQAERLANHVFIISFDGENRQSSPKARCLR